MGVVLILLSGSLAAAPGIISYQGRLTDNTGNPITTFVNVTFTFWDADTNGNQLGGGFSDADIVFPDANGIYSTMIGDDPDNLIPPSVFSGDNVWLNVNVGGENLAPRKRMASVGFAISSGKGSGENIQSVIQDFVVASGESVTAGDVVSFASGKVRKSDAPTTFPENVFHYASTTYTKAAALSDTRFVIAYRDGGNSKYGTAIIGTLSGTNITWGSGSVFNQANMEGCDMSIAALSESQLVIAFSDSGNYDCGTAIVGVVTGDSILFKTKSEFESHSTDHISVARLTDTSFIVAYQDAEDTFYGKTRIGDVSSGSISWRPVHTFNNTFTSSPIHVLALSDTKVLFFYNSECRIGTVNNTSMGFSPITTIFNNNSSYIYAVAALSKNTFVVSNNEVIRVGIVADNFISLGPLYPFPETEMSIGSICHLSGNQIVVSYYDKANSYNGMVMLGTITGTSFKWSPSTLFNTGNPWDTTSVALSNVYFSLIYCDSWNSNYGTVVLGCSRGTIVGIAGNDANGGQSVPVIIHGVSNHHSGLEPGNTYFAGAAGSLSENAVYPNVGMAISDTELLLHIQRP